MTGQFLRIIALSAVGMLGLATLGTPAFAGKVMTVPKMTTPPTVAVAKPVPVAIAPAPTAAPAPRPTAAKVTAPAPKAPPAPVTAKAP